jgi:hypothetical protein
MLEILIEENAYGGARPVEVVAEAPISALIPALVEELHLPQQDAYGNQLVYSLRFPGGGQPLPGALSLATAGVTQGARLVLEVQPVNDPVAAGAGGGFATQPVSPSPFHNDMTLADNTAFSLSQPLYAAGNASGSLASPAPAPRRTRRGFLLLAGVALGAGGLGVGYAAYHSVMDGKLPFLTSVSPTQNQKPQQQATQPQPTKPAQTTIPRKAQQQLLFTSHAQVVRGVAWSPDGAMLASGANDGVLLIWDTQGNVQHTLREGGPVRAVAWSPDGQQVAAGAGNQVLFVDPLAGMVRARGRRHANSVMAVSWSPQAPAQLVSAGADRRAIVWDGANHQVVSMFNGHTTPIESASWAADGQTVATSSTASWFPFGAKASACMGRCASR